MYVVICFNHNEAMEVIHTHKVQFWGLYFLLCLVISLCFFHWNKINLCFGANGCKTEKKSIKTDAVETAIWSFVFHSVFVLPPKPGGDSDVLC